MDFTQFDFSKDTLLSFKDWQNHYAKQKLTTNHYYDFEMPILSDPDKTYNFDIIKAWYSKNPKIGLLDQKGEFLVTEDIDFCSDLTSHDQKKCITDLEIHCQGGTASLEIASLIVQGVESLKKNESIRFQISVNSDFFYSLAKLRAFMFLWWRILEESGLDPIKHPPCIQVMSSFPEQTLIDSELNILRNFNTALVGTISGVSEIAAFPHTFLAECSQDEKLRAQRIARNMTIMAKEEGKLNQTHNAVSGSYLIELLTEKIVLSAWDEILLAEDQMSAYFESEKFKEKLNTIQKKKLQDLQEHKKILIGINKFTNKKATILKPVKLNNVFKGYTRFSEPYEKEVR